MSNSVNPTADLGSTAPECWCTSKLQMARLEGKMSQKTGLMQGEVHHLDAGYHVVGMKRPDARDISLSKE
jgi:hypothetical protein